MSTPLAELRTLISERAAAALIEHAHSFLRPADSGLIEEFIAPAVSLLSSGKRLRGLLAIAGHACVGGDLPETNDAEVVRLAAGLELFQAAALVHDDIMDASPTRRGQPAAHRAFASAYEASDLVGDADVYGTNSGICLGDFLLAAASKEIVSLPPSVQARFHTMATQVAYGQFLDIRAESVDLLPIAQMEGDAGFAAASNAIDQALHVLHHKSASYSVVEPLLLGAELGGAYPILLEQMEALASPLGEAFQLRDDSLGVTGDPQATGKPTGGDLKEGKRTVLILTALRRTVGTPDGYELASKLGSDVSDGDIRRLQSLIVDSGAWDEHELLITQREDDALNKLEHIVIAPAGRDLLETISESLRGRSS